MEGNAVITAEQQKAITGGRKILTIEHYERACAELRAATEFDDAKYFADLADAQIAWAKIKGAEEALRLARALKIKASARLGEIKIALHGIRGPIRREGNGRARGSFGGAAKALIHEGMSRADARASVMLAQNAEAVQKAANLSKPPSPLVLARALQTKSDWMAWKTKAHWSTFCSSIRLSTAREMALLAKSEGYADKAFRDQVVFISEWFDEFLQHLK